MSVTIWEQVWATGPKARDELLVLLVLADHADKQGRCFPSMAGIAQKARMTERGARGIVRRLEAKGYLQTVVGGGRGGKSRYLVIPNPDPETRNESAGFAEQGLDGNPERHDTKPGTPVPGNRQEPSFGGGGAAPGSSERQAEVVPIRPRPAPGDASSFRERLRAAVGMDPAMDPASGLGSTTDLVVVEGWLAEDMSEDEILAVVADTMAGMRGRRLSSFAYFSKPIRRHLDAKAQGPLPLGMVLVGQPTPTARHPKGRTDAQSQAFLAAMREPGVADGPPRDDLRALFPARR